MYQGYLSLGRAEYWFLQAFWRRQTELKAGWAVVLRIEWSGGERGLVPRGLKRSIWLRWVRDQDQPPGGHLQVPSGYPFPTGSPGLQNEGQQLVMVQLLPIPPSHPWVSSHKESGFSVASWQQVPGVSARSCWCSGVAHRKGRLVPVYG